MANRRRVKLSKREIGIKLLLTFVVAILLGVSMIFAGKIEAMLGIGKSESSGKYIDSKILSTYDMRLHYLDVGQADSTFIELPDGQTMLIDAGTKSGGATVVEYIKALGYKQITYFVLTHCDNDHVGGAVNVFTAFDVVNIYRPFQIAGKDTSGSFVCDASEDLATAYTYLKSKSKYASLVSEITMVTSDVYVDTIRAVYAETYFTSSNPKTPSNVFVNYDGIVLEGESSSFRAEFFAPQLASGLDSNDRDLSNIAPNCRTNGKVTKGYGQDATGKNAQSPLIMLEYKSQKFVFTGDMYEDAEQDLFNTGGLSASDKARLSNVTVYQAGHHGARNSNTQDLLNMLSPQFTVVSCGANNSFGHPHQEFLDRLLATNPQNTDYLMRTDQAGTIMFGVNSDGNVGYYCGVEINNPTFEVAWWQIAIGIFIVFTVAIWGIRIKSKQTKKAYTASANRKR